VSDDQARSPDREIVTPDVESLEEPNSFAPKKARQVRLPIRNQRKKPDQISKSDSPKLLGNASNVHSNKFAPVVTIEQPSPKKSISTKPVPALETFQQPTTSKCAEIDVFSQENISKNIQFAGYRETNNGGDVPFKMPHTESFKRTASGRRKPKRTNRGGRIHALLNETIEDVRKHGEDYEAMELVFQCVSDEVIEAEIKMLEQIQIDVQESIGNRQNYKKDVKSFTRSRLDEIIEREQRANQKHREERRKQKMKDILHEAHL